RARVRPSHAGPLRAGICRMFARLFGIVVPDGPSGTLRAPTAPPHGPFLHSGHGEQRMSGSAPTVAAMVTASGRPALRKEQAHGCTQVSIQVRSEGSR